MWVRDPLRTALCMALVALSSCGCVDSGVITVVSLHASEIDPPSNVIMECAIRDGAWGLDESGKLNIALTGGRRGPQGGLLGGDRFDLILDLDEPPAGSGRNYRVRPNRARAVIQSGFRVGRLRSYHGIVGITILDDRRIRGRFRIWMRRQSDWNPLSLLGRRTDNVLVFGAFEVQRDDDTSDVIRRSVRLPADRQAHIGRTMP